MSASPGLSQGQEQAQNRIARYVSYHNKVRLHRALGTSTPADRLAGLSEVIGKERDRKLESARKLRHEKRDVSKKICLAAWNRL